MLVNTGFLLLQLCYTTGGSFSKLKSGFSSREGADSRFKNELGRLINLR